MTDLLQVTCLQSVTLTTNTFVSTTSRASTSSSWGYLAEPKLTCSPLWNNTIINTVDQGKNTPQIFDKSVDDDSDMADEDEIDGEIISNIPTKNRWPAEWADNIKTIETVKIKANQKRKSEDKTNSGVSDREKVPRINKTKTKNIQKVNVPLDDSQKNGSSQKIDTKPKQKLPPIIIHGHLPDHAQTVDRIMKTTGQNLDVKCTRDRTIFKVSCPRTYDFLMDVLRNSNASFHTFTSPEIRRYKVILKGLPLTTTAEEIQDELNELHGLCTTVNQFVEKGGEALPIFSVLLPPGVEPKKIFEIKSLFHTRVFWQKPNPRDRPTQCYRCQEFGHIASNCYAEVRCSYCAEPHRYKDCPKEHEKCANCGEEHSSTDADCIFALRAINKLNSTKGGNRNPSSLADNYRNFPKLQEKQNAYPESLSQASRGKSKYYSEVASESKINWQKLIAKLIEVAIQVIGASTNQERISCLVNAAPSILSVLTSSQN